MTVEHPQQEIGVRSCLLPSPSNAILRTPTHSLLIIMGIRYFANFRFAKADCGILLTAGLSFASTYPANVDRFAGFRLCRGLNRRCIGVNLPRHRADRLQRNPPLYALAAALLREGHELLK